MSDQSKESRSASTPAKTCPNNKHLLVCDRATNQDEDFGFLDDEKFITSQSPSKLDKHRPVGGQRPIEPTVKLGAPRFTSMRSIPGTIIHIEMVTQSFDGRPLFQLTDKIKEYEEMHLAAKELYAQFPAEPKADICMFSKGCYAVLARDCDDSGSHSLQRIQFLANPTLRRGGIEKNTLPGVLVEHIDTGVRERLDSESVVWFLDTSYSLKPPQICDIRLESLNFYRNHDLFRRFVRRNSDEFLFGGVLTAEVQKNGEVIVWSDRFPKYTYPHGINGFIVKSICEMEGPPRILPAGNVQREVYIVNAEENGNVWIQISGVTTDHFLHTFLHSVTPEIVARLRGKVAPPLQALNKEVAIFLAPHWETDGRYIRAVVEKEDVVHTDHKVTVRFIDHGGLGTVSLHDLILASDVHFLLPAFPAAAVGVHIFNIRKLKAHAYLARYHRQEVPFSLQVVTEATGDNLPEVIFRNEQQVCMNREIVREKLGDPVDPSLDYSSFQRTIPSSVRWSMLSRLYLGLGHGERIRPGDALRVLVSYDTTMKDTIFIVPTHRLDVLCELEASFVEFLSKKTLSSSENPERRSVSKVPPLTGHCFLCHSRKLKKIVRGAFMFDCAADPDKKCTSLPKGAAKEHNDMQSERKVRRTKVARKWSMYLFDYGVTEEISVTEIRYAEICHANFPAFGIRAQHSHLRSTERVRHWWEQVITSDESRRKLKEVGIIVEIASINIDKLGEVAKLDCPLPGLEPREENEKVCLTGKGRNGEENGERKSVSKADVLSNVNVNTDSPSGISSFDDKFTDNICKKAEEALQEEGAGVSTLSLSSPVKNYSKPVSRIVVPEEESDSSEFILNVD